MRRPGTEPPTLMLTADCLVCPTPLDLSLVQAVMIWPDDPVARDRAERAATVALGRQVAELLSRELLLELATMGASAIADINRDANDRLTHGVIAGTILRFIIHAAVRPQTMTMQEIIGFQAKELCMAPKTINNRSWPKWRCVAHFWAAFLQLQAENGPTYPHPCRLDDFARFLGLAETFRELGERAQPRQSPRPVLRPGECVRLPSDLAVPRVDLSVSELST